MGKYAEWKWIVNTEDSHISLHDCVVSDIFVEKNVTLLFDDGIDITNENSCNETGRHKRTGRAAVVLHGGIYEQGTKFLPEDKEKEIKLEELSRIDLEILEFSFDDQTGMVKIAGDAWDGCVFCVLKFRAAKVSYCWNEFFDDAWFQDGDKEEIQ